MNDKLLSNTTVQYYNEKLKHKKISLLLKSIFDRLLALLLLILFSPVFFFLAIWIKFDSKGTVFYRQERVTKNGRIFRIYKFRTMVMNADSKGSLVTVSHDTRITKVGRLVRNYRLDELPQLINVLLGDMTFVGTRPEVPKYVNEYSDEMLVTLLLPAGITSLASIEFKDEDSLIAKYMEEGMTADKAYIEKVLPKKMKYNIEYLDSFSFLGDMKIMVQTIIRVLR
ncbi:MAG: sugar transferase [Streptococcus sp.]|nr:sugar transferase [Streptococcus sp.]